MYKEGETPKPSGWAIRMLENLVLHLRYPPLLEQRKHALPSSKQPVKSNQTHPVNPLHSFQAVLYLRCHVSCLTEWSWLCSASPFSAYTRQYGSYTKVFTRRVVIRDSWESPPSTSRQNVTPVLRSGSVAQAHELTCSPRCGVCD